MACGAPRGTREVIAVRTNQGLVLTNAALFAAGGPARVTC